MTAIWTLHHDAGVGSSGQVMAWQSKGSTTRTSMIDTYKVMSHADASDRCDADIAYTVPVQDIKDHLVVPCQSISARIVPSLVISTAVATISSAALPALTCAS